MTAGEGPASLCVDERGPFAETEPGAARGPRARPDSVSHLPGERALLGRSVRRLQLTQPLRSSAELNSRWDLEHF